MLTATKRTEMSLEARLWREVGQHLELSDSVERLFAILSEHLRLDALVIRRLERDPMKLVTIAIAAPDSAFSPQSWPARTDLEPLTAHELTNLFRSQEPAIVIHGRTPLTAAVMPDDVPATVVALPLICDEKPAGIAALVLRPRVTVTEEHLELLAPAIPPLGVAFENDQRLHELARMREALEADREALLSRLGRSDVSEVIIGETGGLKGSMERVEQVAPTDAPVLILGETGSGKEVVARAIHSRSRRSKGPVVRVNCGAIPPDLVDSELFGHEKGSFTGATTTRKGWFERADGGTLFLDEIGELPLAAQVRLLRVLQDGTLERVGGHQTIAVDVRIVAATHRNLELMVAAGTFREDLWYRLSIFPIRLPSLRERPEDLAALAAYFADRAGRRLGGARLVPTEGDLDLLSSYSWPGNVRELAAVIERAAILGNGKRLEVASALGSSGTLAPAPALGPTAVPSGPTAQETAQHGPSASRTVVNLNAAAEIATLDEAMVAHIRRALAACHGRIEGQFGAAKVLGINPHTLRARMRKLGLEWYKFRTA